MPRMTPVSTVSVVSTMCVMAGMLAVTLVAHRRAASVRCSIGTVVVHGGVVVRGVDGGVFCGRGGDRWGVPVRCVFVGVISVVAVWLAHEAILLGNDEAVRGDPCAAPHR